MGSERILFTYCFGHLVLSSIVLYPWYNLGYPSWVLVDIMISVSCHCRKMTETQDAYFCIIVCKILSRSSITYLSTPTVGSWSQWGWWQLLTAICDGGDGWMLCDRHSQKVGYDQCWVWYHPFDIPAWYWYQSISQIHIPFWYQQFKAPNFMMQWYQYQYDSYDTSRYKFSTLVWIQCLIRVDFLGFHPLHVVHISVEIWKPDCSYWKTERNQRHAWRFSKRAANITHKKV